MFSKKPVYNRNSRTSFQKELDAKLKERRSGGYGTGFSDDDNVSDIYSDHFDNEVSSESDDLLNQFATTSNNYSDNSGDDFDHSIYMKASKPDQLPKSISKKSSISGQASQYSSKKEPKNVKNPAFNAQEASFSEFLKGTKSQKLISAKYSDEKVLEELLSGSKQSKETYSDISSKKKKSYTEFSNNLSLNPKKQNKLQTSTSFDADEINFNKTLRSPLLDFIKHTEVENKPVPKQRSKLFTHTLYENKINNQSNDDLIESLLNGLSNVENKGEQKSGSEEIPVKSCRSSPHTKMITSRQNSRKSSVKSNKSYHSLLENKKKNTDVKTEQRNQKSSFDSKTLKFEKKSARKHEEYNSDDSLSSKDQIFKDSSAINSVLQVYSNEKVKGEDNQSTFVIKEEKNDQEILQSSLTAKTTQNICNVTAIETIAKTNEISRNKTEEELKFEVASTVMSEKPKSAKKKKSKLPKNYVGLGSLSAHKILKSPRPETNSISSTRDIRQTVYLEWLEKREKERKEKRLLEKKKQKEEQEKKDLEAKEKHEDALVARKYWEKTKKEQQQRKERLRRRKEQERRRQILEKEEERWKNSKKCDAIRRKALEEARRKNLKFMEMKRKELIQKEEDNLRKRQESKKEVTKWKHSRGEKWKEDRQKEKAKAEEEKTKKEREMQEKERKAAKIYEEWWHKKMNQQQDKKTSSFMEERPAWSPANKLVTSR